MGFCFLGKSLKNPVTYPAWILRLWFYQDCSEKKLPAQTLKSQRVSPRSGQPRPQASRNLRLCVLSCFSHVQLFVTPIDHSPPGSSVHGIFQTRILEWVAMPSSRGSSQPRDRTHVSCVSVHWQEGSLPICATLLAPRRLTLAQTFPGSNFWGYIIHPITNSYFTNKCRAPTMSQKIWPGTWQVKFLILTKFAIW